MYMLHVFVFVPWHPTPTLNYLQLVQLVGTQVLSIYSIYRNDRAVALPIGHENIYIQYNRTH